MAKIIEYKDIPLNKLTIGKAQVRVQAPGAGIEELAESIRVQGLLQPIVVCKAETDDKWEILTGQRRFLAHRMLERSSITAAVLDESVNKAEAKSISITENLLRRKLTGKELIDGITFLYNHYTSANHVAEATGIPYQDVLKYVKYPRLYPELKKMVDNQEIDVKVALHAQDAASNLGGNESDVEVAVRLAKEMKPMTGVQRKKLKKILETQKVNSLDDVIEIAVSGSQVFQINATVTLDTRNAIQKAAKADNLNQDETAANLIEEALINRGLLS